jgi:digeranylgeranylglycerophospholipid reductase
MKTLSDAVVVGGGPVGSFAALSLARLGVKVTVFEEHAEIGIPSHCAGHLSIRSLKRLGLYPLGGKIVENTFSQANFHSPMGAKLSVRLARPVTCVVNRTQFDEYLAEKAKAAGARYCLSSRVRSLLIENGHLKGVSVEQNGKYEDVLTKIVVDSEGIASRLLKQAGLSAHKREGLVYAVEAEVENVQDVSLDAVEIFLGADYAPGFYAWLIPRLDGTAKVGLASRTGNPEKFLHRFMRKHPVACRKLSKAKITQAAFHPISLGGPIDNAYANGFLAVGDAASQVKPTTGGGVIFGLTCARIAAQVASEAIKRGDLSANYLRLYQKRCKDIVGFDVTVMLRTRKFLNALSDEQLDAALRFCTRIGVNKTLEDVKEIDFQGRALLSMLKKPTIWAALAYFFALYFAANP